MSRAPEPIRPLVGAFFLFAAFASSSAGAGAPDEGREALGGKVTAAASGEPIAGVTVTVWEGNSRVSSYFTGATGEYSFALRRGTYFVTTMNSAGFIDELYDNKECAFVQCLPSTGTPIRIAPGSPVSGIDFQLDRGATITGTVLDAVSGGPVARTDELLLALSVGELKIKDSHPDSSGTYAFSGLPTGEYFVKTAFSDYQNELYDDVPCLGAIGSDRCDSLHATPISVAAPATVSGIDFALERAGVVSGFVVDRSDGRPIPGVRVRVLHPSLGTTVGSDSTDDSGAYEVGRLEAGTYMVEAIGSFRYFDELYDGIPCPRGSSTGGCDLEDGTPIEVAYDSNARVDFALSRLGTVSGTVRASDTGQPLPGVEVEFFDENGRLATAPTTDDLGRYRPTGVFPGTYFLATRNRTGEYVDEVYNDIPCDQRVEHGCDFVAGTPVTVALETETSGIDFDLPLGGRITGTLTDRATGAAIRNGQVVVSDELGRVVVRPALEDAGTYLARALAAGKYFVHTSVIAYVDEIYDDIPCVAECDPRSGIPIDVALGATSSGIDFSLQRLATLSGRITGQDTGEPLAVASVFIYDSAGAIVRFPHTDAQGRYVAEGLDPGTYFASAKAEGYVEKLFDDLPCAPPLSPSARCDLSPATPIRVDTGDVTGVDFELEPESCSRLHGRLCLNDERFRVEVTWRDGLDHSGFGRPVGLTDDSGYFWFFNRDNLELVVKVLDGCFAPFETFWVFAAGLTNVATEITVTDLATGTVKRYRNPQGRAFQPILDTAAFPTCDAALAGSPEPLHPKEIELARKPAAGAALKRQCPDTELCLGGGRFVVEAFWRTAIGETGLGRAVLLTSDTGYFWFFGADNVEVVVKVLDACDLDPFNKYWFFAAGLTSVEVTLRVTDVITGKVAEYTNLQGNPFRPIQDTATFDTCP